MNIIWGGMLVIGMITALFTGNIDKVNIAVISAGKEAVNLGIAMMGVVAVWTGVMRIGEKSGMLEVLTKKLRPVLRFLFPDIPENHKVNNYIATNFAANFLGLGWAATPSGLLAMKELDTLNKGRKTASKAMCMFMIINMSSIQLITVNVIAYRGQYGSQNPTEIILPGIIATAISTMAGIIFAKINERLSQE